MIKTILVEDESYIRKGLISLINTLDKDLTIIGECGSVAEAVTVVKACKPDLIFLDINLPDGNAFDFLELTKELEFKVIFITAYDQYALQALKLGAIDYILKPVDIEELETAIDKVIDTNLLTHKEQIRVVKEQLDTNRLVVSLHDGYQVINTNELMFCKSDKGYTTFYLSNSKSIIASKPIKYFVDKLPVSKFVRTHQSCLVNLDYVDRYDKSGVVILRGNQKIPVSIRKKEEFLNRLLARD
ncbi:LytTR family DNA-binding domain-containing protein [Aquimarina sp. 2201CG5-10]|uniref:LytR/AlgR family response regulator transcription factor n=1 Tax=Aquimarina callyspongiae TaxID=3098150 RepID=UPI002AB36A9D|nr:LytTR family DNA-binding domain-containing protein [Aquimarina sp. 2201CG5-10]MDY8136246.1 LytTR family DNA-binding domain-containing protein [Aquimarina sp. 2201CG5-10]